MPGSAHSSSIGRVTRRPGLFAAGEIRRDDEGRPGEAEETENRRGSNRLEEDPGRDPIVQPVASDVELGLATARFDRAHHASLDRSTIGLYRFPHRLNSPPEARKEQVPLTKLIAQWPVVRQLREGDPLGLGRSVQSKRSRALKPRVDEADHVVQSVCPYCAVGCGQLVYVKDGEV